MHESFEHDTMSTREWSRGSTVFVALLCGAAVGAAVGVLLAPKAGRQLRQQLADSAGRMREKVSATYSDASQAVGKVVDRGRRAFEVGKDAFQSGRPAADVAREVVAESTR